MDPSEQAFLDGTHPALHRDAEAMATLRSTSPTRSRSPSVSSTSSSSSAPRFSAIDPDPPAREPAPLRSGGKGSSNTGVKGVRADYREYQESKAAQGQAEGKGLAKQMGKKLMISLEDDSEDDQAGNVDEDQAALERYRQQRMRELQGSGERGLNSSGGEKKVFGHLREIGFEQFLSAVEGETDDVAVVLHLYEPDLIPCILLNSHLTALSRKYPHTKFLRALASELDFMQQDPEDETLPTVLVYRRGELETTWVRFDLELEGGGGFESRDAREQIERILLRKGAIEGKGQDGIESSSRNSSRPVEEDDDDDE
ncbi:phosducin family protein [Sporobolomyces salmoneus]|uniref:phosducin family protein n=1 Tax=Sporobolomyces salmoneus TaxID=183962 RepID=UPI003181F80C